MLLNKKEITVSSVEEILALLDTWKSQDAACSVSYRESFEAIYDQMKEGLSDVRKHLIKKKGELPMQIYCGSIDGVIHGIGIVFSDENDDKYKKPNDNLRFLVSSPAAQTENLRAGSQLLSLIVQDISQPTRLFTLEATTTAAGFYEKFGFKRISENSWDNTMYYPSPSPTTFAQLIGAFGRAHDVSPATLSAKEIEVHAA